MRRRRRAGEWRRLATNYKEAACCSLAAVQGAARQKNGLCKGSDRGNWGPRRANSHFDPTQTVWGIAPPRLGGC